MNNKFKNYYKILGISQNASSNSIENAARREMEYANPTQRDLIREAASVLLNNELRARYDEIYNENVAAVERLKQNAVTQSDFLAVSSMANRIKSLEEEIKEKEVPTPEEPAPQEPAPQEPTPDEPTIEEPTPQEPTPEEPTIEEPTPEEPTPEETENIESKEQEKKEKSKLDTSIGDGFAQNLGFDDETLEQDALIKAANRKKIINNSLIIGGSTVLFGPIGTLVSTLILKKKGKLKLQKLASKGKIKELKTLESKIIEAENKKLDEEIDELLKSPLSDNQSRYKLELAKKRYENQVDLLQKRIEFKKNEKSKLGGKAYNRLHVLALETRFAAAIKSLEIRKKMAESKLNALNSYNPNKNKHDRLTKIQKEIDVINNEIETSNLSDFKKNQKLAKINRLNTKKIQEAKKMSLKKNGISRNQVVLAVFNSAKDKITNLFSYKEEKTQETMDLNSFSNKVR